MWFWTEVWEPLINWDDSGTVSIRKVLTKQNDNIVILDFTKETLSNNVFIAGYLMLDSTVRTGAGTYDGFSNETLRFAIKRHSSGGGLGDFNDGGGGGGGSTY